MTSRFKIIFSGPLGAGKSAAIAAVSDVSPVHGEGSTGGGDPARSRMDMDYGAMRLGDGSTVHLYGAPGREPLEATRDILTEGGVGLILLIDSSRNDPLADLAQFVAGFERFIASTGLVIGVTHRDLSATPALDAFADKLAAAGYGAVPVFEADPRDRRDVGILIEALLSLIDPVARA